MTGSFIDAMRAFSVMAAGVVALSACGSMPSAISNASTTSGVPADFNGLWMPDPQRAQPWPDELPLTAAARAEFDAFIADQRDPAAFCMPFGTPRNMLSTEFPLEILQTQERITLLLQSDLSNPEVRRVYLKNRNLPQEPQASWFGTSIGRWEGSTLVIETVGIDTDVIVSSNGLPHSDELRIIERLRIENDPKHGRVLVDEMTLHDPKSYTQPITTTRYFVWAPYAQMRDSHCAQRPWIDKLWRDRLREHKAARTRSAAE